ncbi:YKT6 [Symbiodinium sp. KB8]|nr:YKT6 [Symbiodinium sp. KB8]
MAGQADKKQAKKAESSIQYYLYAIIAVNALYFLGRVVMFWSSMGKWNLCGMLLFTGVSYFTFGAIKSSLEIGANYEMYLDLFLVNLATQALVTLSDYGWLLYLAVPSYAGWKVVKLVMDYVFTPTDQEMAENDPEVVVFLLGKRQTPRFDSHRRGGTMKGVGWGVRLSGSYGQAELKGQRQSIDFDQNLGKCYSWSHPEANGPTLTATVLVDGEYPMRVAFALAAEAIRILRETVPKDTVEGAKADMAINSPEIQALFAKFQNPAEADKLTKIEKDLEEVKGVVMQSMDDLLKRGESLDQLMQKSKDLSSTSVQFYRTAKKNNQCCKMY